MNASWTWLTHGMLMAVVVLSLESWPKSASAQITPDASLGAESSIVNPTTIEGLPSNQIDGGATRGQNLFHSFQDFNIEAGTGAYFGNPAGINNIFSRVTGSNASNLQGTLGVLGNANLFFLNPNGIIFGPSASLDVNGSFLGTTANAIQFGNQGFFNATNPAAPPLLTIDPSALLFNQLAAQSITSQASLAVPENQSLLMVGGNLSIEGGVLFAPGGRIELGSVAGSGTVNLTGTGNNWQLGFLPGVARADVSLNNAAVDVSADVSGSAAIFARNLVLTESIFVGVSVLGTPGSKGGTITVNTSDSTIISGGFLGTITQNVAAAGDIFITTENLLVTNNGFIGTSSNEEALGAAGDINIAVSDSTTVTGASSFITTSSFGQGNTGNLSISTESLKILDSGAVSISTTDGQGGNLNILSNQIFVESGGSIGNNSAGTGTGGTLTLSASQSIFVGGSDSENASIIFASVFDQGDGSTLVINTPELLLTDSAFILAQTFSTGDAGAIEINAGTIQVENGARISSTTFGAGSGGSITINAADSVVLNGIGDEVFSGIFAETAFGQGDAGTIEINTGTIQVENGARISSTTFGAGSGGSITINASDSVVVSGTNDGTFPSGIFATTSDQGNAGEIEINAETVWIENGAQISVSTDSIGSGGNITIDASDSIVVGGRDGELFSTIFANSFDRGDSGTVTINTPQLVLTDSAFLSTQSEGTGNAGAVNINAETVRIENGAQIFSSTFNTGVGGIITINAADSVLLDGTNGEFVTGIFAETAFGQGDAGTIEINAGILQVEDGAQISSTTLGAGSGGSITIYTSDSVLLDGTDGESVTGIFALAFDRGDAGTVDISAGTIQVENGAQISSSTFDAGSGGNITIDASKSILLSGNDGEITSGLFALSEGSGEAGDILLTTGQLTIQSGAVLSTSTSGTGNSGDITVNATDSVVLDGAANGFTSGLTTTTSADGDGGNIQVNTQKFVVQNGAEVEASAIEGSSGNSGNVLINATDSIQLLGTSIDRQANPSKLASDGRGAGSAGDVILNTQQLTVADGARISSSNIDGPGGGDIIVNATDSIDIIGTSKDRPRSSSLTVQTRGTGPAGNIFLTTNTLNVLEGAEISASTFGSGQGGSINIDAGTVTVSGISADQTLSSTIVADTGRPLETRDAGVLIGTGDGGSIAINADLLTIQAGAAVTSESLGEGGSGSITLNTQDLTLNAGSLTTSSNQTTGGDITIDADLITLDNNSLINTRVADESGDGGNITINSDTFIALNNSDILATAVAGKGGDIAINANVFLIDQFRNGGSTPATETSFEAFRSNGRVDISATSVSGTSGNITTPDFEDVENALAELNSGFISADRVVAGSCLVYRQVDVEQQSSFTVGGADDLPANPFGLGQIPYRASGVEPPARSQASNPRAATDENDAPVDRPLQEATQLITTAEGRQVLVATSQLKPMKPAQALICP